MHRTARWSEKSLEEDGSGYKEKKLMKGLSINEYHNPCKDA